MGKIEEIRARLKERIKAKATTQTAIAKATGIDQASLSRFVKGTDGLGGEYALRLAEWERSIENLPTIRRTGPLSPVEYVQGEGLKQVGVYGSAEAGKVGLEIFNLEPSRLVTILERYYRNGLIAIDVEGKSMEPTIKKGAVVGVVPVDGEPIEGEIYLIKRPHLGLLIKRIFVDKGMLILKSDNPEHPPIELPYEGHESDTIILGRVYWIMQEA